jgi:hypothetical protein
MLNNTTIFILNIIILFIIININNKLKIIEGNKEKFAVIMSDTLGPKIGEVFNKYFKLNLIPLRQLGSNVESLLKGRLNGNLTVRGNIVVNKDNNINSKCKITKNINIDNTLTLEGATNFNDNIIINNNDLMINNNAYFNNTISSKKNYNYIY